MRSFRDSTKRFRCCTSYVQAVVNEIVLRYVQLQRQPTMPRLLVDTSEPFDR